MKNTLIPELILKFLRSKLDYLEILGIGKLFQDDNSKNILKKVFWCNNSFKYLPLLPFIIYYPLMSASI